MNEERIKKLNEKLKELLEWKSANSLQQIELPMGTLTEKIVHGNRMVFISRQSLSPSWDTSLEVSFKGVKFLISASTDV